MRRFRISANWTPAGGPYRVTAATTVPTGLTLTIQPGTSVYFDQNVKLTVNGTIKVLGTQDKQVVFSNVPGTTATDPITGIAGLGSPPLASGRSHLLSQLRKTISGRRRVNRGLSIWAKHSGKSIRRQPT